MERFYMEPDHSPACRKCGKAMIFTTRISMPRQIVWRCDPCKSQEWILERGRASEAQQQQQPQKKDGE
jgi:hypothetical protein